MGIITTKHKTTADIEEFNETLKSICGHFDVLARHTQFTGGVTMVETSGLELAVVEQNCTQISRTKKISNKILEIISS